VNNYLNIHILSSVAFANPNRDDAGAPKTAYYGGVERARMSSQSLKRAARIAFEASTLGPTIRSAKVADLVKAKLDERGLGEIDTETAMLLDQAIRSLVEAEPKPRKPAADEQQSDETESGDTLMWLSETEVTAIADALEPHVRDGGKLAAGAKLTAKDIKNMYGLVTGAVHEPALSIAAFGRMFANSVDNAVDAAVQVSHALSTHAHAIEVDYFTAVDDLQKHGAGHIGLNMFTGAVYYRHLSVDRAQLGANLGDRLEGLRSELEGLLRAMIVELPRGKQTTTAHQSLPSAVLIVEGSRPANLVEAFEAPVKSTDGYVIPSVEALADYISDVRSFAPEVFGRSWFAGRSVHAAKFGDATVLDLTGLASACASWALEPTR